MARPLLPPFADARYLLGTDRNGRDIAAGIAHGARVSLAIGVTAAAGAILIGTVIGALAGFYRGWTDEALMRLTEAAQTVPNFLLALALVAVLGPATWSIITAIALVSWPATARIVRAEFLSLREREFVLACRTMGMGDARLIFGQMLPNAASSIVVLATVVVSIAILVESALSYLGLGDPNIVTWGGMIAAGRPVFRSAWTVSAIPGLAIVLTVLGVSLIGEALTDALNPRNAAYLRKVRQWQMSLLEVEGLTTRFHGDAGTVTAVDGISFTLERGETLAIVGESGSGKSTAALSLLRLVPVAAGTARLDGRDLLGLGERDLLAVRGAEIGMVFQEPMTSLNPVLTVGEQITEVLRAHGTSRAQARSAARSSCSASPAFPIRRDASKTIRTRSPAECGSAR